jgi:hypothetical protein
MVTYGEQMKGVRPWLVPWACRAGKRDFYPALAALFQPSKKDFFCYRALFHLGVSIA